MINISEIYSDCLSPNEMVSNVKNFLTATNQPINHIKVLF